MTKVSDETRRKVLADYALPASESGSVRDIAERHGVSHQYATAYARRNNLPLRSEAADYLSLPKPDAVPPATIRTGADFRNARLTLKLSGAKIAALLGVTPRAVRAWECDPSSPHSRRPSRKACEYVEGLLKACP